MPCWFESDLGTGSADAGASCQRALRATKNVMNGQLNGISQSMVRMTRDTDQMSRPMRMMPWP